MSCCVFAVPLIHTTPSLSVSTWIVASDARFSAASFVLILVVIAESFTNVAGLLRSVSESVANATGASEVLRMKHAVASLSFTIPPIGLWSTITLPFPLSHTYQLIAISYASVVLHDQ